MLHRAAILLLFACLLLSACRDQREAEVRTARVARGDIKVQTVLEGTLDTRRVEKVISSFAGGAVLTELVPEGAFVKKGDIIARFDDAQPRRDFMRLERDTELARLDFDTLERTTIPLELGKSKAAIADIEADFDAEKRYVAECGELVQEGLMNRKEMEQAQAKVDRLGSKLDLLRREYQAMETTISSSRVARAKATLHAAERELMLAREQVENCIVRAPADGGVVYLPLHLGNEYRVARVGDTILKNQPFLSIPDQSEWISLCSVPEMEVDRIAVGAEVVIQPLAMPTAPLKGRVESIGGMAQEMPGRTGWAKFFRVVIKVEVPQELLARVKSGMTVQARVTSANRHSVLTLPRAALDWSETGEPMVSVRNGDTVRRVPVRIGLAADSAIEIVDGLGEGDEVVLP